MTLRLRALAALDRFNAAHPWDHNAHYHRWILRQVPKRCARALDIGCGSGELAGLLATRAETVIGIDADPTIVALARGTAPAEGRMSFVAGDALTAVPRGPYAIVTCVAAVHHTSAGRWTSSATTSPPAGPWWSSAWHGPTPSATTCWAPSRSR